MTIVKLPRADGSIETHELGRRRAVTPAPGPPKTRVAYAAAHIVADPLGDPVGASAIDWEATMAFRHHLWSLGLGVADAMDTAQRGMGLATDDVRHLIRLSIREARSVGGLLACGITTDELDGPGHSLDEIVDAYLDQLALVEEEGGTAVMMASRALVATAQRPDDYADVYRRVLSQASRPVIIHWLGPMFDPALDGYWGSREPYEAMESLLGIVSDNASHVDGTKISMLDQDLEVAFRRRLPDGVRCYTGDDFGYPDLIRGDERGHSDALLGIFDPIAPVAAAALQALDAGDTDRYDTLLGPTLALGRHVFEAPTYHYKVGVVFLAYLAGHQAHPRLVGGIESGRSVLHLAELVRRAETAGVLPDPELAAERARHVFAAVGVGTPSARATAVVGDHHG